MTALRALHPSPGSVWVSHFVDLLVREVVRRWPAAVLADLKRPAAIQVPADDGINPALLGHAIPRQSFVSPDNGKAAKRKQAGGSALLAPARLSGLPGNLGPLFLSQRLRPGLTALPTTQNRCLQLRPSLIRHRIRLLASRNVQNQLRQLVRVSRALRGRHGPIVHRGS